MSCCAIFAVIRSASPDLLRLIKTIRSRTIHTGMHGVAYTVFQGVKPEPMDVEVLAS